MIFLRAIVLMLGFATMAVAEAPYVLLQSTTSTQNSGLFDAILPQFTEESGIEVRVVAVGTGQAMRNAQNGDGDVVLVHARAAEDRFVAEGWGVDRRDVMYNDFVIVGPRADPAGVSEAADLLGALQRITTSQTPFLSRGDDSGTHKAELRLWAAAGIDPAAGDYREAGAGMGTTLNIAVGMAAYTLSDRATWMSFGNKSDFTVLVEGDPLLFNPYGVIRVNPERHPHVNATGAQAFVDWLTGPAGQAAIGAFRIDNQQVFFPNAQPSEGAKRP